MSTLFRVAWYRFRATFSHRWSGYLTIVLLVGLVGGVAMGAIAGARRTQSSFPIYAASTNPSQVDAFIAFVDPAIHDYAGYYPAKARAMAHLPHVKEAETAIGFVRRQPCPPQSPAHARRTRSETTRLRGFDQRRFHERGSGDPRAGTSGQPVATQ